MIIKCKPDKHRVVFNQYEFNFALKNVNPNEIRMRNVRVPLQYYTPKMRVLW